MKLEGPVIAVRPYANNANYWQVYFDTNEAIVQRAMVNAARTSLNTAG